MELLSGKIADCLGKRLSSAYKLENDYIRKMSMLDKTIPAVGITVLCCIKYTNHPKVLSDT